MPDRPKNFSGVALAPAADDFEVLDGPTLGVRKISAATRAHARNALAPRGGVVLDGTTDKRVWAPISSQVLDSTSYSINVVHKVRTANPDAISQGIFILASGSPLTTGAGTVWAEIDPSGNLNIRENNAGAGSTTPIAVTNFVGIYGGTTIMLTLVRAPAGWTLYLNGVPVGTSTAVLGDTVANGAFGFGAGGAGTSVVGTYYSATLYNLALSAADILEIFVLGGAVPERFRWGSQALLNTQNFTTSGGFAYDTFDSVSATGFHAIDASGIGRVLMKPDIQSSGNPAIPPGAKWRTSFTATLTGGDAPEICLLRDGVGDISNKPTIIAGANVIELTAAQNLTSAASAYVIIQTDTATEYTIASYSAVRLGAVVHLPLDDGGGYQLRDLSSNALHGMMTTSGVTHVAPGVGPFRFRAKTSTSGGEQLQLATALPANAQLLRVRARAQTGAPTVSLGTTSGGAQVVASTGLTSAWKLLPLALAGGQVGGADISLWATSNTGDVIEWDLAWEPQSF